MGTKNGVGLPQAFMNGYSSAYPLDESVFDGVPEGGVAIRKGACIGLDPATGKARPLEGDPADSFLAFAKPSQELKP